MYTFAGIIKSKECVINCRTYNRSEFSKRSQIDWWDSDKYIVYLLMSLLLLLLSLLVFLRVTFNLIYRSIHFNGMLAAFIIVASTINFSAFGCTIYVVYLGFENVQHMQHTYTHISICIWICIFITIVYLYMMMLSIIYDFNRFWFISSQILCQYQIKEKSKMNSLSLFQSSHTMCMYTYVFYSCIAYIYNTNVFLCRYPFLNQSYFFFNIDWKIIFTTVRNYNVEFLMFWNHPFLYNQNLINPSGVGNEVYSGCFWYAI